MEAHDSLARLKREIGPDLYPVKPLAAPGLRLLGVLAVWIALGVGVSMVLGLRQDYGVLGPWRSVGFSLIEVALCGVLVLLSLRLSIPAIPGSISTALSWMAVALILHIAISWATLERSVVGPAPGQEWQVGLTCLSAITVLGLGPLTLGAVLLVRGLLTRRWLAFALTGFASGLAAEATWRLHCPYSTWEHVLLFHSGALVLFVLLAAAAALIVRHRT